MARICHKSARGRKKGEVESTNNISIQSFPCPLFAVMFAVQASWIMKLFPQWIPPTQNLAPTRLSSAQLNYNVVSQRLKIPAKVSPLFSWRKRSSSSCCVVSCRVAAIESNLQALLFLLFVLIDNDSSCFEFLVSLRGSPKSEEVKEELNFTFERCLKLQLSTLGYLNWIRGSSSYSTSSFTSTLTFTPLLSTDSILAKHTDRNRNRNELQEA